MCVCRAKVLSSEVKQLKMQVSPVILEATDPVSNNWTQVELQYPDHLSATVSSAFGLLALPRSFPREKAQSSQRAGCSWTHLGRQRDDGWLSWDEFWQTEPSAENHKKSSKRKRNGSSRSVSHYDGNRKTDETDTLIIPHRKLNCNRHTAEFMHPFVHSVIPHTWVTTKI